MNPVRLSAVAALFAAPLLFAANGPLSPGRWEITMTTVSPVKSEPMVTEVCISKEKAEKPQLPTEKSTDDCKVVSGGLSGSEMSYVTKCKKRDVTTVSRFTFRGDTYDGVVEIKAEGRDMRQVYSARRIGDCPEETPRQHPAPVTQ